MPQEVTKLSFVTIYILFQLLIQHDFVLIQYQLVTSGDHIISAIFNLTSHFSLSYSLNDQIINIHVYFQL